MTEVTTRDLSMDENDQWVVIECRPHNSVCKFKRAERTTYVRDTAYSRKLLARTVLPSYMTMSRCGKKPSNEAVASMLQPYVKTTLTPSSSVTMSVASFLHEMAASGKRTHARGVVAWGGYVHEVLHVMHRWCHRWLMCRLARVLHRTQHEADPRLGVGVEKAWTRGIYPGRRWTPCKRATSCDR